MRHFLLLLILWASQAGAYQVFQGPPAGKTSDTAVLVTPTGSTVVTEEGLVGTIPYHDLIRLGKIPGHSPFRGFGQRPSLSTVATGDDIWTGTATTIPIPDQTTGDALTCVSTSAADASPSGANVRKIDLHYLTLAGAEAHANISLNGTTPVSTGLTGVRHIQYIHSEETSGYGVAAAGVITCYRTGDAARVYAQIPIGANVSLNSQRMVPAGKTFYMNYISVSGASGKPLSVRLRATNDFEGLLTPGIFIFNEVYFLQDSVTSLNLSIPRKFPALSIIKATVYSTQAGGDVSVSYGGWIE